MYYALEAVNVVTVAFIFMCAVINCMSLKCKNHIKRRQPKQMRNCSASEELHIARCMFFPQPIHPNLDALMMSLPLSQDFTSGIQN